jgi:cytosine/adenosine deaminase-related metal-dependent hydrolase
MRESAALARQYNVMLHTHLAETHDEEQYCLSQFGMRPLDYAQHVDWIGSDVWFAHGVHFNKTDIHRMAERGCGVAHCPSSNMRLASGIAPIRLMLDSGMNVGLGVDGSASNDGSHLIAEARQAMLLQRVQASASSFSALEALWIATRGGASVLGRDDIGQLAPGYAADVIAVDLNRLEYAGALHDPVAAVIFCAPRGVDFSMINGRVVVRDGQLVTLDPRHIIERHNAISAALLQQ